MNLRNQLTPKERDGVLALISAATNVDGVPPISEHVLLHLRHGGDKEDRHLIVEAEGIVRGYAHLDLTDLIEGPSVELVVHPDFRGTGIGESMLAEARTIAGDHMRLWSHGDLPAAAALATSHGFERVRSIIQLRRSLLEPIPEPTQINLRHFEVGRDEEEWIELNNQIFSHHPEQGSWERSDLDIRIRESWFDPQGFLLATNSDGELMGFCWTKIHGGISHHHGDSGAHDHDPMGEIYIVGVRPDAESKSLGSNLTVAGLRYLRDHGIFTAMLYVDAGNERAIRLYQRLGFTEWGRDVMYRVLVRH